MDLHLLGRVRNIIIKKKHKEWGVPTSLQPWSSYAKSRLPLCFSETCLTSGTHGWPIGTSPYIPFVLCTCALAALWLCTGSGKLDNAALEVHTGSKPERPTSVFKVIAGNHCSRSNCVSLFLLWECMFCITLFHSSCGPLLHHVRKQANKMPTEQTQALSRTLLRIGKGKRNSYYRRFTFFFFLNQNTGFKTTRVLSLSVIGLLKDSRGENVSYWPVHLEDY